MDTEKNNSDWTEVEIQAAVDAYLSMLSREQAGQAINKAHENRVLREGVLASRTKGSVEFRMQNISTVLVELGRRPIEGYKPAKNVGPRVTKIIREALNAPGPITPEDLVPTADEATLEQRALKLERRPIEVEPKGIEKPEQTQSSGKSFVRDPGVRAWVRQQAKGKCEGCGEHEQVVVYKQGQYQGKPDTKPWDNESFAGDRAQWEASIKARNQSQNEYRRING